MTDAEYRASLEKSIAAQNVLSEKQKSQIKDLSETIMAGTEKISEIQQLPAVQPASQGSNKYILIFAIGFIVILLLMRKRKNA